MRISDWSSTCALPIFPAIFSLPASLHIVETEGLARPDGLGPGLAVPEVNIEQMVELRLAKAGDDARLGRKFCETVACRIVTRPVANECAARNARLGEANPARSEEHTSDLQSLMRHSYAVFC